MSTSKQPMASLARVAQARAPNNKKPMWSAPGGLYSSEEDRIKCQRGGQEGGAAQVEGHVVDLRAAQYRM